MFVPPTFVIVSLTKRVFPLFIGRFLLFNMSAGVVCEVVEKFFAKNSDKL